MFSDNWLKVDLKDVVIEVPPFTEPKLFVDVEIENHSGKDLNIGTNFLYVNNSMVNSYLSIDIPDGETKSGRIIFDTFNIRDLLILSKSQLENIGFSFICFPMGEDGFSIYESEYVEAAFGGNAVSFKDFPIYNSNILNIYNNGYSVEEDKVILSLYFENLTDDFVHYDLLDFKIDNKEVSYEFENNNVLGHKGSICNILLSGISDIFTFEFKVIGYNYDPNDNRVLFVTNKISH